MKRMLLPVTAMGFILLMSSCSGSSSLESDIKKMADYRCEMIHLRDDPSEKAQEKLKKLQKELEDYSEKMEKKYKDKKDDTAWVSKGDRLMEAEMAKCK